MSKEEDFYIAMLRVGRELARASLVINFDSMRNHLEKKGHQFDEGNIKSVFDSAFEHTPGSEPSRPAYSLKLEAYVHLIQYEGLEEARQSSADAKWMAIWAIVITGALAAGSIGLQVYQIFFSNA